MCRPDINFDFEKKMVKKLEKIGEVDRETSELLNYNL